MKNLLQISLFAIFAIFFACTGNSPQGDQPGQPDSVSGQAAKSGGVQLLSSASGQINRLLLVEEVGETVPFFRQFLLEMVAKKSAHTQIVVAYRKSNDDLGEYLKKKSIETTMDSTNTDPSVVLLLPKEGCKYNSWVRDPFIVAGDFSTGQRKVMAREEASGNGDNCSSTSYANSELANWLVGKKIISEIESCTDWFAFAGGNLLVEDGVVLAGGNEFDAMLTSMRKSEGSVTYEEGKSRLAALLGIDVGNLFIISSSYEDQPVGGNEEQNELFNPARWYDNNDFRRNRLRPVLEDTLFFKPKDWDNVKPTFKDSMFLDPNNWDKIKKDLPLDKFEAFKKAWLTLQNFVHIDLFITLTGERSAAGKHKVLLCKLEPIGETNTFLNSLIDALNDVAEELAATNRFEIIRNPTPYHYSRADGTTFFQYNNCLVENIPGMKTVWLPAFASTASSRFTPDQLKKMKDIQDRNVEIWKDELNFKVQLIEADFYKFSRLQGSVHCLTKEIERDANVQSISRNSFTTACKACIKGTPYKLYNPGRTSGDPDLQLRYRVDPNDPTKMDYSVLELKMKGELVCCQKIDAGYVGIKIDFDIKTNEPALYFTDPRGKTCLKIETTTIGYKPDIAIQDPSNNKSFFFIGIEDVRNGMQSNTCPTGYYYFNLIGANGGVNILYSKADNKIYTQGGSLTD